MTVMVSGGFDPLHKGHVAIIQEAARYGDVVVVLNSDAWLLRKKGFVFQPWNDRRRILQALSDVSEVEPVDDRDGTVVEALTRLKPAYFANGGDRGIENTPEIDACRELGIKPIFGIGGDKIASSSAIASRQSVRRTWGTYDVLHDGHSCKVKRLVVDAGAKSSMQRHFMRSEVWFFPNGEYRSIPAGTWHQLDNPTDAPLELIEVQIGHCREDDIERQEKRN